jgi:hypothetical protein
MAGVAAMAAGGVRRARADRQGQDGGLGAAEQSAFHAYP